MNIKAIETSYRGYKFRSRTEARWAVFFDALKIEWEYEREGFDLGDVWYLPDFWLPKHDCFVEIKGHTPTVAEREKALKLAYRSTKSVIIIVGQPGSEKIECFCVLPDSRVLNHENWHWKFCGKGCVGFGPADPDELFISSCECDRDWCRPDYWFETESYSAMKDYKYDERLRDACYAARSERFGT